MSRFPFRRAAVAALAALLWQAAPARADIADYAFELVEPTAPKGDGAVIAVRLVDRRSGAAVPDAVIFATRIDMAPDGMETMTSPIEAMPSTEPGVYLFRTDLVMAGGWRLSLAAKVQGEEGTLENQLVLTATP
jgi:hypothetical protein